MDIVGADAIRLILTLIARAPGDESPVEVGTGPLEDLINGHGDALVDLVEHAARQSPEFAQVLGGAPVKQGGLTTESADRLARWLPAP